MADDVFDPGTGVTFATKEIGGAHLQRVLLGYFARLTNGGGAAAAPQAYAAGDAIGAGAAVEDVPVGVYAIRNARVLLQSGDAEVPGLRLCLNPSDPDEAHSPPDDGDPWTPPLDTRALRTIFVDEWEDPFSLLGNPIYDVVDHEQRIAIEPALPDGTRSSSATATLYAQAMTEDAVTFSALAGVQISLLLEFLGPIPDLFS